MGCRIQFPILIENMAPWRTLLPSLEPKS